jgi:hypothetical protein
MHVLLIVFQRDREDKLDSGGSKNSMAFFLLFYSYCQGPQTSLSTLNQYSIM